MKRILLFSVLVVLSLWAVGMGVGGAIAEENASDQAEPDGINASEIEQAIDSQTYITSWSFEDGQFVVEFYAEEPVTLTVAESGSFEEGTGEFAYYARDLPEGEHVETFRVLQSDGAALTMATPLAQQEERGAFISTGTPEENPFRHFGGESGLFSGVLMTVAVAAGSSWYVVRSEDSGVIEA